MVASRVCTKCKVEKPLTDFSPHARGKYGRQPSCRPCDIASHTARRKRRMGTEPEKVRAEQRAKYARNRDARRVAKDAWIAANRDRVRASQAKYEEANKERVRAAKLAWHANNRLTDLRYANEYNHRRAGARGRCTTPQMQARIAMYGGKCWVPGCGREFEAIDHVIALSKGGTNWPANLRPICKSHNSTKGARSWRMVA